MNILFSNNIYLMILLSKDDSCLNELPQWLHMVVF